MARLRWRAIARALGVPRNVIAMESHIARRCHRNSGNIMAKIGRWTLPMLRDWASEWSVSYDPPQTVTLSLGPDGLRIEERES